MSKTMIEQDDSKLKREAAERIYLQLCDDSMSEWCGEVTWCEDRVHDEDVEYIRADVVERLRAELAAITAAIPGVRYMDPPDGGSVTLAEQVARMAKDADELTAIKEQEPFAWWSKTSHAGAGGIWMHKTDESDVPLYLGSPVAPVAGKDAEPVAIALHYPECWDTAAYPTVWDALAETVAWFKCNNDDCCFAAPVADKDAARVSNVELSGLAHSQGAEK